MSAITIPQQGLTATHQVGDNQLCINLVQGEGEYVAKLLINVSRTKKPGGKVAELPVIGLKTLSETSLLGVNDHVKAWLESQGLGQFTKLVYRNLHAVWRKAGYRD